jgi:hypothetical protein
MAAFVKSWRYESRQRRVKPRGNHNHGTLVHLLRMTVISRGFQCAPVLGLRSGK